MSVNDISSSKNNVNTPTKVENATNDDGSGAINKGQIWGSGTNIVAGQNPVHYPIQFPFDPNQVGYDMNAYTTAPMYQYNGNYPQFTSDGYQQNYDENYQNPEGLANYDGSNNPQYQYNIQPNQGSYYAQENHDGQNFNKKENISIFDNSTEYTARWVSSTSQIPANLKVSPDHPTDAAPQNVATDYNNWDASQGGEYQNVNNSSAQQTQELDQQLAQMNLGYGQQQYLAYGYAAQAWQQGTFTPQDNRNQQNTAGQKGNEFFNPKNNVEGYSSTQPKPGAPGQASWADMVKKNGASSGDVKIIHQPPPPQSSQIMPTSGGQRNQHYQRNNQQNRYDKNNSKRNNNHGNGRLNNVMSPNQPTIPFNFYGNQQQNMNFNKNHNNHQNRNGNNQKSKQNLRPQQPNFGYAGFGNTAPGTSAPLPSNYPVPSEYNPYVPPPPLIPFNPRAASTGLQQQQQPGAPIFTGSPYIMYNPAQQQQMRYFSPQFVVRPDFMPPMYNMNEQYFQMRFRPPFDFDPRFGPSMFGMPRYRYQRNNRQNGRGKYKQRPGSKESNTSPKESKEGEKLDEALAESVNRGPDFNIDENATPEPKGDIATEDTKDTVEDKEVERKEKDSKESPTPQETNTKSEENDSENADNH